MLRRRNIAASPMRRADETWDVIVTFVADTLDCSSDIERADVINAFEAVATIGPRLIAARHLEKTPLVLLADPIHLSLFCVSGADALSTKENLSPVPGGSSATTWKVYFPAPETLEADILAAVATSKYLTVDSPPSLSTKCASGAEVLDLEALARRFNQDNS